MSDPENSMFSILKPYQGFEETYQGGPLSVPIPMLPVVNDQVLSEEDPNPPKQYDPRLARYLPVPLGSTLMLWFPIIAYEDTSEGPVLVDVPYKYQLRWRLRSIQDYQFESQVSRGLVYSVNTTLGQHTSQSGTDPQYAIPACIGDVIAPTIPAGANTALGVNFAHEFLSDSQGFYGSVFPDFPEMMRGPIYFPPVLVPALGNELAIYAFRDSEGELDTWDFAGTDRGFSQFYGVGRGESQHIYYPSHGIYVASLGRSTYP